MGPPWAPQFTPAGSSPTEATLSRRTRRPDRDVTGLDLHSLLIYATGIDWGVKTAHVGAVLTS